MDHKLLNFLNQYPSKTFSKREVILRSEQEEAKIFFIRSGFVRAHTTTKEGNEFSVMLLGPQMYFPLFRYLPAQNHAPSVTTRYSYSSVTVSQVTAVDYTSLLDFFTLNVDCAKKTSDEYYSNLKLLLSKLEFMVYTHSAYRKVSYFLLFLSKRFGQVTSEGTVTIPGLTHWEFATFLGLSRESVSHKLSLLKSKGVLSSFHPVICVKDLQLLEIEASKE